MPLLGNPTAAVLYPGKLIYALLPYPWAARIYIIAHTVLAFVAMLLAMRSWGVSWAGSAHLCAQLCLRRADPLPVLQHHLPGRGGLAPLRLPGGRSLARAAEPLGLLGLAVVLAMQTLGGDPQSAYLLGLCGGATRRGWPGAVRAGCPGALEQRASPARHAALVADPAGGPRASSAGSPAHSSWPRGCPSSGRRAILPPALPWMPYAPAPSRSSGAGRRRASSGDGGAAAGGRRWGACSWAWRDRRSWRPPSPRRSSSRSSSSPSRPSGPRATARTTSTRSASSPTGWSKWSGPTSSARASAATPTGSTRYDSRSPPEGLGAVALPRGLGLVLALGGLTFRRGHAPRVWLSWIVAVSLVGSLGQYTSPIWAARHARRDGRRPGPGHRPARHQRQSPRSASIATSATATAASTGG